MTIGASTFGSFIKKIDNSIDGLIKNKYSTSLVSNILISNTPIRIGHWVLIR
jgi:hypothetical protein